MFNRGGNCKTWPSIPVLDFALSRASAQATSSTIRVTQSRAEQRDGHLTGEVSNTNIIPSPVPLPFPSARELRKMKLFIFLAYNYLMISGDGTRFNFVARSAALVIIWRWGELGRDLVSVNPLYCSLDYIIDCKTFHKRTRTSYTSVSYLTAAANHKVIIRVGLDY